MVSATGIEEGVIGTVRNATNLDLRAVRSLLKTRVDVVNQSFILTNRNRH